MQLSSIASSLYLPLAVAFAPCAFSWEPAGDITVVYSEITTDSSSSVAGIPGLTVTGIARPFLSPDGTQWMIKLKLSTGSSANDEVIVRNGAAMVREGTQLPYLPPLRKFDSLDKGLAVANSGAFVFSGEVDGNLNVDDMMFAGDPAGNIVMIAQEGSQIAGAPAGWLSRTLDSPIITAAGPGYQVNDILGGLPSSQDEVIMLNGAVFLQTGVDFPLGQMTGQSDTYNRFDLESAFISSDSSHYLLEGRINGSPSVGEVLVVDGVVVLQVGFPIPGADPMDIIDSGGIRRAFMAENGNWIAHGDFDGTEHGYVVHNGLVVARQLTPIHGGTTEKFDEQFTMSTCNGVGDFVIAGISDAPLATNGVMVLNNSTEVCREGDAIDLDGNGVFDDDVFISSFNMHEAALSNSRIVHFVAQLKDGAGANLGEAYLVVDAGNGPWITTFCNPGDANSTGVSTLLGGIFGTGVGSGLHLEVTQGPPTQFGYFLVGTGSSEPGLPLGQGHLCMDLTGGNSFGRYNVAGTDWNSIGIFDAAGVFQNLPGTSTVGSGFDVPTVVPTASLPSISSGQTWHFQCWHREDGGQSNFSNGVSATF